jgi:nucleolar protein 56
MGNDRYDRNDRRDNRRDFGRGGGGHFVKKGPTKRERILEEMKQKMRTAYLSRDAILVYIDGMIEDLEKTLNLLFERLNEWYSLYFPELKLLDRNKYCRLVLAINKEDMKGTEAKVKEIMGDKSDEIMRLLGSTIGIELLGKDIEKMQESAKQIMELEYLKAELEKYEEGVAKEVCPNMAEVGGAKIAAKLIAHVGGLQKLAKLPASTIQVLGAEKALFKHLKQHTKAPKHGLIFQQTAVHSAPRDLRGKVARTVASKLSIAVKMDMYGKRFIGKELKEKMDARIKSILEHKSKPKPVSKY